MDEVKTHLVIRNRLTDTEFDITVPKRLILSTYEG